MTDASLGGRHLVVGVAIGLALVTGPAHAGRGKGASRAPCTATAMALFTACRAGVTDDAFVRKAKCLNISDTAARETCSKEAATAKAEDSDLCREQRDLRLETCKRVGEARYDPVVDPAAFDDPKNPTNPNPYFPLGVGNHWEYRSATEVDTVDIVNETKLILGVTCIVARDLVVRNGNLAEATDDWYAQAKDRNTWYFGEEVKDFESFDGDDPRRPELVDIGGHFKAGVERDKPGVIFLAAPKVGDIYFEEFALGTAEDVTEVLSTTYSFGSNPDLDQLVPQQLAQRLCAGDCVVTKNFSLLEPGDVARKYYAPGIGVFLEVEPDPPVVSQLVDCNFDARCVGLPTP